MSEQLSPCQKNIAKASSSRDENKNEIIPHPHIIDSDSKHLNLENSPKQINNQKTLEEQTALNINNNNTEVEKHAQEIQKSKSSKIKNISSIPPPPINYDDDDDDVPVLLSKRKLSVVVSSDTKSSIFSCFLPPKNLHRTITTTTTTTREVGEAHPLSLQQSTPDPNVNFDLEEGLGKYKKGMKKFIQALPAAEEAHLENDKKIKIQHHLLIREDVINIKFPARKSTLPKEKLAALIKLDASLNALLLSTFLHNPQIPLAIYISENKIIISTPAPAADNNNNNPNPKIQIICELTGEIRFLEDGIIIGNNNNYSNNNNNYSTANNSNNSPHDRNSINLNQLIKSSPTRINYYISFESLEFTFTPAEILTLFFLKLFQLLKGQLKSDNFPNAVVIFPDILTSFERKRLEKCAKVFQKVRIVSMSTLSALHYAYHSGYFLNYGKNNILAQENSSIMKMELIIVAKFSKQTFAMSLMEIGPNFIFTKSFVQSQDIYRSFAPKFMNLQEKLFSGDDGGEIIMLRERDKRRMRRVYSRAVNKLFEKLSVKFRDVSQIVILCPENCKNNEDWKEIWEKTFGKGKNDNNIDNDNNNLTIIIVDEENNEIIPTACVWAAAASTDFIALPSDVDIYDESNFVGSGVNRCVRNKISGKSRRKTGNVPKIKF